MKIRSTFDSCRWLSLLKTSLEFEAGMLRIARPAGEK